VDFFFGENFPQGNFPEFFEITRLFTAVNLDFYKSYHLHKFFCDKSVTWQKIVRKASLGISGNIPGNSWIKNANNCLQPVNYTFNACHVTIFSPEFYPVGKKFPKFDKIVRNIFRGIFLRRKFPQGNFPEFFEIKHSFTAVNLYFCKMYHQYKFFCDKFVVWQKNCQKSFLTISGNIPDNLGIKVYNPVYSR
jgi:hypothetical protein